jgi:alpha-tubulin suppressor-like RCC1 family protein
MWWPTKVAELPPDSIVLPPVHIGQRAKIKSIATGWLHDCALTSGGLVICNGHNGSAALGRGGLWDAPPPRIATNLRFSSITAGRSHTCALTAAGHAYCWGMNDAGQTGVGTRVELVDRPTAVVGGHRFRMLSAGSRHTCGITLSGSTLCWGANTNGQLGRDPTVEDCMPDASCMAVPAVLDERRRFMTVAAGAEHTCGVTYNEQLYCWGHDYTAFQQTNRPSMPIRLTLVKAPAAIRAMSAGRNVTCGMVEDGQVYCWGSGSVARPFMRAGCTGASLCIDTVPVSTTIRFREVAVGEVHACGIGRSGAVYCWGIRDVRRESRQRLIADRAPPCTPSSPSVDARCALEPFRVLMPNVFTDEPPRATPVAAPLRR